jgi:hypothetical protein
MLGIFASAVPSAQLATNLPVTDTISLPPSISLSIVAVVPSNYNFLMMEIEGIAKNSPIIAAI